jgi:K+-sensing histidine kinase KdpD
MFRNAIDNAFSFASTSVQIRVGKTPDGQAKIEIQDDGPGFSLEALALYGERRVSRVLGSDKTGSGKGSRLSVGLGSVIIMTVAKTHRGSVQVDNIIENEATKGARVVLTLPIESGPTT